MRESVKNAATPILPYVGGASSKIAGATGALRNTIKVRADHMGGFIQSGVQNFDWWCGEKIKFDINRQILL